MEQSVSFPYAVFFPAFMEAAYNLCYYLHKFYHFFHFPFVSFFQSNNLIRFERWLHSNQCRVDNLKIIFRYCDCSKLRFLSLGSCFQVLVSVVGLQLVSFYVARTLHVFYIMCGTFM
jgi:hypothetical protein